jgi:hypothetical protein
MSSYGSRVTARTYIALPFAAMKPTTALVPAVLLPTTAICRAQVNTPEPTTSVLVDTVQKHADCSQRSNHKSDSRRDMGQQPDAARGLLREPPGGLSHTYSTYSHEPHQETETTPKDTDRHRASARPVVLHSVARSLGSNCQQARRERSGDETASGQQVQ